MKKKFALFGLLSASLLSLSSCDFIQDVVDDIFPSNNNSASTDDSVADSTGETSVDSSNGNGNDSTSVSVDSSTTKTFSHTFSLSDFSVKNNKTDGGTTFINGVTFDYDALDYIRAYQGGVQLGSANNSVKDWSLTAYLPSGCTLQAFSVTASLAKGGENEFTITTDANAYSEAFENKDGTFTFFRNNLNDVTDTLEFNFNAIKNSALYLYSIRFTVYNPDGITDDISSDDDYGEPVVPGEGEIPETQYAPITKEEYYKDIDLTETGTALENDLREKISVMTKYDYGDAKYTLLYTDESLDHPGYDLGMWDGDLIKAEWTGGGSWQREHVWAASHLGLPDGEDGHDDKELGAQSDIHNLRVACAATNNYHSNRFFGDEDVKETSEKEGYYFPNVDTGDNLNGIHEFSGDWRGDTARIVFYMAVRYDNLKLNDDPNADPSCSMGDLSVLLKWNEEDPVDDFEIQRNNRIYEYQGNRNPFIDYPSLADQIW